MIYPTLDIEQSLWRKGYSNICGMDEVGRGCFAGPVVVGAVIFPKNCELIEGLADSKLLKPRQRESLESRIKRLALCWAVAEIGVLTINKIGIGKATQMAFRKALKLLRLVRLHSSALSSLPKGSPQVRSGQVCSVQADYVLIDAFYIKHLNRKRQKAIKKGDMICASISAASIIAKVYRDKLMKRLHKKYPQYGFAKHKGYGTKKHQEAIQKYGLSKIHRKSFNLQKFLI